MKTLGNTPDPASGTPESSRQLWEVRLGIWSSEADALDLQQKITHLLCPDPEHNGPCPIPWQLGLESRKSFGKTYESLEEQVAIERDNH